MTAEAPKWMSDDAPDGESPSERRDESKSITRTWPLDEPRTTIDFTSKQERARTWCSRGDCSRPEDYGQGICTIHGARLPLPTAEHAYQEHVRTQRARQQLHDAAPNAAQTIAEFADPVASSLAQVSDAVRLKASTELLDRVGVRGGMDLRVDARVEVSPSEEVRQRLDVIASRLTAAREAPEEPDGLPPVIEGETIPEPPEDGGSPPASTVTPPW